MLKIKAIRRKLCFIDLLSQKVCWKNSCREDPGNSKKKIQEITLEIFFFFSIEKIRYTTSQMLSHSLDEKFINYCSILEQKNFNRELVKKIKEKSIVKSSIELFFYLKKITEI